VLPLYFKDIKKVLDKIKKVCYNIREEKEKNLNVTAFSKRKCYKTLDKEYKVCYNNSRKEERRS
jgi:hypothetical protein